MSITPSQKYVFSYLYRGRRIHVTKTILWYVKHSAQSAYRNAVPLRRFVQA